LTTLIDLTRRLDAAIPIYRDGDYSDPPLVVEDWCGIEEQGFWVSKLQLGTQTGTHIDAPAHLVPGGAMLDTVRLEDLVGDYFLVRLDAIAEELARRHLLETFDGERILLAVGREESIRLPFEAVSDLVALGCPVWAIATEIQIVDRPPLRFHYLLAENGIFLIEELDHAAAVTVPPGGRLIALPLRLEGVGGSPCRVVVEV
jgi:arylformamidase